MKFITAKISRTVIFAFIGSIGIATFSYAYVETKVSRIDPGAGILTMVNVLTPAPGKQLETIKLLQAGMDETMRHQPGFISANIHRSLN